MISVNDSEDGLKVGVMLVHSLKKILVNKLQMVCILTLLNRHSWPSELEIFCVGLNISFFVLILRYNGGPHLFYLSPRLSDGKLTKPRLIVQQPVLCPGHQLGA